MKEYFDGIEMKINFNSEEFKSIGLFTGRKNGKIARSDFSIKPADQFFFYSGAEQVITSSFFLGLVGEELKSLFNKIKNTEEFFSRLHFEGLNDVSKSECIRGIKRGIISDELPF